MLRGVVKAQINAKLTGPIHVIVKRETVVRCKNIWWLQRELGTNSDRKSLSIT